MSETLPVGSIRHGGEIEDAISARLSAWLPAYLAEVERQHGERPGTLPPLRSIASVSEAARFPEQQLPAGIVVAAGTTGPPMKEASGYYRATYSTSVGVVVSAPNAGRTRELAHLYGAATLACLGQRRSLSRTVEVTSWQGEELGDLADFLPENRRSIMMAMNLFEVELRGVFNWKLAPPPSWTEAGAVEAEPPEDPSRPFRAPYTATTVTPEAETL